MEDASVDKALALMAKAEEITGLNDWGSCKGLLFDTISLALRRIEFLKQIMVPEENDKLISDLQNSACFRLRVEHELKAHPEIHDIPIKAPVFIVGSYRTGTTLLQNLINEDPLTRTPLLYEMRHPSSAPKEERVKTAQAYLDYLNEKAPMFDYFHHMGAEEVEECTQIIEMDMIPVYLMGDIPFATEILSQPSRMKTAMEFHKTMMKLYEFQNPKTPHHWTFKSPLHVHWLLQLLEVYPDAQFIMTHRDPKDILSSNIALFGAAAKHLLIESAYEPFRDAYAKNQLKTQPHALLKVIKDLDALEKEGAQVRVVHCRFDDLVKDPEGLIGRIYEKLGRQITPEFRENLNRKFAESKEYRKTRGYSHSLADVGLTEAEVVEASTCYMDAWKDIKFV